MSKLSRLRRIRRNLGGIDRQPSNDGLGHRDVDLTVRLVDADASRGQSLATLNLTFQSKIASMPSFGALVWRSKKTIGFELHQH
jgi:hypothetical protein